MERTQIKKLTWTIVAVLVAAWLVPSIVRVNFWKGEIAAALSRQLHRAVQIGDVHLQVIEGVGFEIDNVAIDETPEFGSEPFARIDSLSARLAISSIWHGRIEFSNLFLTGANFNIVRANSGNWNLVSLISDFETRSSAAVAGQTTPPAAPAPSPSVRAVLPRIQIESGRINFKAEDRKKAWCFEAVSINLLPPESPREPWRFELAAVPTRTDIPFHATTSIEAHGQVGPFGSSMQRETGVPLRMDWSTSSAMLAELLTIGAGRDLGIHGVVNMRGHVAGTTSLFRIQADSEIRDLHRWDLFPNASAPSIPAHLAAIMDLSSDTLELTDLSIPLASGRLDIRGRAGDFFNHSSATILATPAASVPGLLPATVDVEMHRVPLSVLASLGSQFTPALNRGVSAEGTVDGSLHADGMAGPLYGTLKVSAGSVQPAPPASGLHFDAFDVALGPETAHLGPVRVMLEDSEPLLFSGEWKESSQTARWHLRGDRIALSSLEGIARGFGLNWSIAEIPEGTLALQMDGATTPGARPAITGTGQILDAELKIRNVEEPLRISAARLQLQKGVIKVQPLSLSFGPAEFDGAVTIHLSENPQTAAPEAAGTSVDFALDSPETDAKQIAALFTRPPRSNSFFGFGARAAAINSPVDQKVIGWLDTIPITGTLHASHFLWGSLALENLKTSVRYRDRTIELPDFSAEHAGGTERGTATLRFRPAPFSFVAETHFANADLGELAQASEQWRGLLSGRLNGSLRLASSGRNTEEIATNLSGSVEATGRDIALRGSQLATVLGQTEAAPARFASLSVTAQIENRRIHFTDLQLLADRRLRTGAARGARHPEWSWSVAGDVGFDGSLNLTVEQNPEAGKAIWAGTLAEPRLLRTISGPATARDRASLLPR